METPDATYEDQAADTTSLDHHRMSDPTIPQATSLTFTARMELVDTTTHGAPANRADVEGAPCGQQQQIPQILEGLHCRSHKQMTNCCQF